MRIIAVHHVKIGKRVFHPNALIDVEIPQDKLERLIAKGAVREVAPFAAPTAPRAEPVSEPREPVSQREFAWAKEDIQPGGKPVVPVEPVAAATEHVAPVEPEGDEQPGEVMEDEGGDADEDGEEIAGDAPVIDVMEGVVVAPGATVSLGVTETEKPKAEKPKAEKPASKGRGKAK